MNRRDSIKTTGAAGGGIVAPQRLAIVYTEPASPAPVEGLCFRPRSLLAISGARSSSLDKHPDPPAATMSQTLRPGDPDTKELLQRRGAHSGCDVEHAVVAEESIGQFPFPRPFLGLVAFSLTTSSLAKPGGMCFLCCEAYCPLD